MDLAERFPIIPHRLTGAACNGGLVPRGSAAGTDLVCNVCMEHLGYIETTVLTELVNMISGRASDRYLEIISKDAIDLST